VCPLSSVVCLWLELCGAVENVVDLNFLVLPTSVFSFLCFLIVLHAIFVFFTFLLGILADHLCLALFLHYDTSMSVGYK